MGLEIFLEWLKERGEGGAEREAERVGQRQEGGSCGEGGVVITGF